MATWLNELRDEEEAAIKPRKTGGDTELDMTPMIDCTFLLLIFFTVAGKLDPSQLADIPRAKHGAQVDVETCIVVTMVQEGETLRVFLSDGPNGPQLSGNSDEIREQVRAALEKAMIGGKKGLVIKAGKNVKSHEVTNVARAAGECEGATLHFGISALD